MYIRLGSKKLVREIILWMNDSSESNELLIQWFLSGNLEKGTREELKMKHRLQPLLPMLSKSFDNEKYVDENNQTILHLCILHYIKDRDQVTHREVKNDVWFIAKLCTLGASIIGADRAGNTPLGMVLSKNRMELVDRMLHYGGTYVNVCNRLGQTALHIIIDKYDYSSNEREPKKLIDQLVRSDDLMYNRRADLKRADANGMTPGHLAVKHCYLKLVEKFQRWGLLTNSRTNLGDDLVILACKNVTRKLDRSEFIDGLLIEEGFKANCKNNNCFTPLHYASIGNNLSMIMNLVRFGANMHSVASDGTNAFHSAVVSADNNVMQYFIRRRVKFYRRDNVYGFTLMHMAAFSCDQVKLEWLIEKGFDPNDHAKCNVSPLHLAAMVGNVTIVKKLLEHGAEVHCRDETCQYTALHLASMCGKFATVQEMIPTGMTDTNSSLVAHCLKILRLEPDHWNLNYKATIIVLLEAGADVNAKDYRRRTPLHYATRQKNNNFVKILLTAGADVDDLDCEGFSPLHNCLTSDNEQGMTYLLRFGADINDIEHYYDIFREISNYHTTSAAYRLLDHIVKLKVADLPVNDVYRPIFNDIDLKNDYVKYFEELKKLKELKVAPNVSLYDMLHMNSRRRFIFIGDLPDLEICNPKIEFPHYFIIIEGFCHEAVNRKALLVPAKMSFRLLSGIQWPDICVEYIFSFLNNRTLRVIIEGATEREKSDLKKIDDSEEISNRSSFRSLLKTPSIENFFQKRRSSLRAFFSSFSVGSFERGSTKSSV